MRGSVQAELALARRLFTLAQEDSRIGFEASNQYYYLPVDLVEKVINCRWLLSRFDEQRANESSSLKKDATATGEGRRAQW